MGQKMNPNGLRVGIIKDWNSKWYADSKHFADYLVEDHKIREYVKKKLYASGISKVEIERTAKFVKVNVYTAKPGLVIGKGGNLAESLKAELQKMIGKDVNLNIVEVKSPDLDAQLVAENIAGQLERRISFRRAMKQCMQKTMKMGALGIKTSVSGRLGVGADVAWYVNRLGASTYNSKKNAIDIPIVARVSYTLKWLELQLSYKQGTCNLMNTSGVGKVTSRNIQFSVFMPIFK